MILPMFKRGDRVRVIVEDAPPCREGTIVEIVYNSDGDLVGYRVHHDASPWSDGLFAGKQDFNWMPSEVVRA